MLTGQQSLNDFLLRAKYPSLFLKEILQDHRTC